MWDLFPQIASQGVVGLTAEIDVNPMLAKRVPAVEVLEPQVGSGFCAIGLRLDMEDLFDRAATLGKLGPQSAEGLCNRRAGEPGNRGGGR
jgi:hypothetical protein